MTAGPFNIQSAQCCSRSMVGTIWIYLVNHLSLTRFSNDCQGVSGLLLCGSKSPERSEVALGQKHLKPALFDVFIPFLLPITSHRGVGFAVARPIGLATLRLS